MKTSRTKRYFQVLLVGLFLTLPFASKADVRPVVIGIVEKTMENGRTILWGLCEDRYKVVHYYEQEYGNIDPNTGESIMEIRRYLECYDPGWARCRQSPNSKTLNYKGFSISDQLICNVTDELQSFVDEKMMVEHVFSGKISKKICVSNGTSKLILLFEAVWEKGDANGNGHVVITIFDITNLLSLK